MSEAKCHKYYMMRKNHTLIENGFFLTPRICSFDILYFNCHELRLVTKDFTNNDTSTILL